MGGRKEGGVTEIWESLLGRESGAKGRQVSRTNSVNIALESGRKMKAAVPLTECKEIGVSKLGEF